MFRFLTIIAIFAFLSLQITASPSRLAQSLALQRRTDPTFPPSPPSCPICEQGYPNIQGCAQAAPVLANFSMIIFNPGAFIDVIKCACADTFQSVFPQCVDCFIQTNQTQVLDTSNLPGIVAAIRNVCAIESTLLGNVSGVDASLTATPRPPAPTSTSAAVVFTENSTGRIFALLAISLFMGCLGM
ncbi:hypothetical protein GALMADRAFT_245362 [Galerina marginata CBS 339.88]|uniref:Extracellular membrane protein CFEM domain-containing protein n=1 Tax=Galerina marginata (strain CBS 339.88) TaxID=685588 RepID=A0A067T554_GALM3|nr:hypothetical protein GALMADRAFT_245362 [Galerina marginata CBS 339.88]